MHFWLSSHPLICNQGLFAIFWTEAPGLLLQVVLSHLKIWFDPCVHTLQMVSDWAARCMFTKKQTMVKWLVFFKLATMPASLWVSHSNINIVQSLYTLTCFILQLKFQTFLAALITFWKILLRTIFFVRLTLSWLYWKQTFAPFTVIGELGPALEVAICLKLHLLFLHLCIQYISV